MITYVLFKSICNFPEFCVQEQKRLKGISRKGKEWRKELREGQREITCSSITCKFLIFFVAFCNGNAIFA